nr:MAG TPA: hypothetical protein [Caudoviricetes sp.]
MSFHISFIQNYPFISFLIILYRKVIPLAIKLVN